MSFFHLFTSSLIQASIFHAKSRRTQGLLKMPLKKFTVSVGNALSTQYHVDVAAAQAPPAAQPPAHPPAQPPGHPPALPPAQPPAQPGPSCPPAQDPTSQAHLGGGHFSAVLPPTPSGKKNFQTTSRCKTAAECKLV